MRVATIPGFAELTIIVNPTGEITREGPVPISMPWLYAPWLDSKGKGVIDISVEGETLKALLNELSRQHNKVNIDFDPINPTTNHIDFDYYVSVNGKNCVARLHGLNTKLEDGDEVKAMMVQPLAWRITGKKVLKGSAFT